MEGVWQVWALLWLIKLCVKLVSWRTTSGERTRQQKTEVKVKTVASEEEIWPLLEELSEDKDEGAEKELQDQPQKVHNLSGKGNSTCNDKDEVYIPTPIRVKPEPISNQIPIPLTQLNDLIDRQMQSAVKQIYCTEKVVEKERTKRFQR